jgi:hypothetical protein
MKKTHRVAPGKVDGLRPECEFDRSKAVPYRYGARLKGKVVAVLPDADVAQVFPSSDSVNKASPLGDLRPTTASTTQEVTRACGAVQTRRQAADLSRRVLGTRIDAMATQPTTRDRILEALQGLPADATLDDAIEKLVFLAKIEGGLDELDEGQGVPHADVKGRLGL